MLHSPTLLAGLTTCIALKAYRIISNDAAKTTCQVLAVAVYVHPACIDNPKPFNTLY